MFRNPQRTRRAGVSRAGRPVPRAGADRRRAAGPGAAGCVRRQSARLPLARERLAALRAPARRSPRSSRQPSAPCRPAAVHTRDEPADWVNAKQAQRILLTSAACSSWWLHDYFPATRRLVASRETPLRELASLLGRPLEVIPVPIPADCADGFEAAYWCRPHAYLDPRAWRAMSALALIPGDERDLGMRRLRDDLGSGEWQRWWGHLLGLRELDLGYRVIAARP